jgi:hypothetical protein
MNVSGFTFIHNGVRGGYPFVEAIEAIQPFVTETVVVDMQSTDQTRSVLEQLHHSHSLRVIDGTWTPGAAGECLKFAHAKYVECAGDVVWHFEADEVYEPSLAEAINSELGWRDINGLRDFNILVYRLQVSQNFQRCRWYPEAVHRVWNNTSGVVKKGHTTNINVPSKPISSEHGYLWDCTNCFRDDYMNRIQQQAELWGTEPNYLMVPIHANHPVRLTHNQVIDELKDGRWTVKRSPFDLPMPLRMLLGVASYEETLKWRRLIA